MRLYGMITLILVLLPSLAVSQIFLDQANGIGLFLTSNPAPDVTRDMVCYYGAPGAITVYAVLTNPVNESTGTSIGVVGGFEFKVNWPAGAYAQPELPPGVTNGLTAPNFLCSGPIPVVNGQCTLVTFTVGLFTADPAYASLTAIDSDPSFPGLLAISDANDGDALSPAYPIWDLYGPNEGRVFVFFQCDDLIHAPFPVPGKGVSFGGVKALYR